MSRNLLLRPIAVTMCVIALVVLGILSLQKIPVSLMPDIDIPRITVQISAPGSAAGEVEQRYVNHMRHQLSQVAGLKHIESTSRMDAGTITLEFEAGSNMSLLFIEVSEKIDRAMNLMPKEMERPKVVKASAMDVPAFYLDVCMKDARAGELSFAQLSRFVRNIVSKRIEQLPQTAMVDISGTVGTEIDCLPDYDKLAALGLTVHDIERAIKENNITLEALSVRDGIYRYNIHFDSQLLTKEDIANIYLKHDGRLLQLKDLCRIEEQVSRRNGMVRHGSRDAVTMAIIKQNDARMEDLQTAMDQLLDDMRKEYPDVEFSITRDQTRLLTYTIQNLKGNLLVGALLACLVIFLFMRRWRLSLLVAVSIPLSVILTLLAFYVCGITINVISLSGLILGVGMIVDNSIIVIDNIMQHWQKGEKLTDAVVRGTKEVVSPLISSVLTTCSVFIPLIFLSGTAGSLFYDQAMGVTFALTASLMVAVIVLPVYFYAFFRKKAEGNAVTGRDNDAVMSQWLTKPYEHAMRWVLRHGRLCLILFLLMIPLTAVLFGFIEKERMPGVPQEDTLVYIDWNLGITADENARRVETLLQTLKEDIQTSTSMIGAQEFLLSHTKDITSSEAVIYIKCATEDIMKKTKKKISSYLESNYPTSSVEYGEPGNIYDLIFSSDEADLNIHLQTQDGRRPDVAASRCFVDSLRSNFPSLEIMPVVTETTISYVADTEKMAYYKVSYEQLHGRLKELMSAGRVFEISDGAQSVPVMVGEGTSESGRMMGKTVTNTEGTEIPVSFLVTEVRGEYYKRLQASSGGEYYCININAKDRDVRKVMDYVTTYTHRPKSELTASFSGGYFSSRDMIRELSVVLLVALALLYFILAAQFESLVEPFIILMEMVVDIFFVLLGLLVLGESLNIMSMIGIVVMSGIVINDSILKIDTINKLRRSGYALTRAVWLAGHRRLRPIVMTSLTTILALLPFLTKGSMGAALQYPLSLSLIIGMTAGTMVSLFFVPLLYSIINRKHCGYRRQNAHTRQRSSKS